MEASLREYRPAEGSPLTQEQASRYGTRIQEIRDEKGFVVADHIVADAKGKESPLHDFFEWDDTIAATKYRHRQAGDMLRWIHVVVKKVRPDGSDRIEEETSRAYVNVQVVREEKPKKVFMDLKTVLDSKDLREQMVRDAFKELKSWRKIHSRYVEFRRIYEEIDRVEKALS